MYLTQTNVIRHLSKEQYSMLREMCRYSNNLYNYGLYCVRQHYFSTKTFLPYESNYHVCKHNENYTMLQAGVSQQILRVVDRSFKSFFNLINIYNINTLFSAKVVVLSEFKLINSTPYFVWFYRLYHSLQ